MDRNLRQPQIIFRNYTKTKLQRKRQNEGANLKEAEEKVYSIDKMGLV